jgi:hypothetical protein
MRVVHPSRRPSSSVIVRSRPAGQQHLVAAWRGRAPPGSASGAIMQTVTAADIALCGTFRAQVGMRTQSA